MTARNGRSPEELIPSNDYGSVKKYAVDDYNDHKVNSCVLLWLTCQGGFQVHVLFRLACQEIFLHECKPMSGESNGGIMFLWKMWMIISNDSKSEIVPGKSQEISKHQPHGSIIQIPINNRNCFIITGDKWEDERRTSTIMIIKFHFVS